MEAEMDKRYWTAEEEKYMNKYYLRQPNKRTAKALNRTVESVRKKAARMGINTYYDGYLSARVLFLITAIVSKINFKLIKR